MKAFAVFENVTGLPICSEQVPSVASREEAENFEAMVDESTDVATDEQVSRRQLAETAPDEASLQCGLPQILAPIVVMQSGGESAGSVVEGNVDSTLSLVSVGAGPGPSSEIQIEADSLLSDQVLDVPDVPSAERIAKAEVQSSPNVGGQVSEDSELAQRLSAKPDAKAAVEKANVADTEVTVSIDASRSDARMAGGEIGRDADVGTEAVSDAPALVSPKDAQSSTAKVEKLEVGENRGEVSETLPAAEADTGASRDDATDDSAKDGSTDRTLQHVDVKAESKNSTVFAVYEAAAVATARPSVTATSVPDQSALMRNVSSELGQAIVGQPDGTVELTLAPDDELGHVKVSMRHEDGVMSVSIQADRQETIDLMRRHIDVLTREMRDLGFTDVGFNFNDRGTGQQSLLNAASVETSDDAGSLLSAPTIAPDVRSRTGGMSALDLRM